MRTNRLPYNFARNLFFQINNLSSLTSNRVLLFFFIRIVRHKLLETICEVTKCTYPVSI